MRLEPTNRAPCELERGQARRVSLRPQSALIGYHVCCPKCGYVTLGLNGKKELVITENDDRTCVTLSHPLRCLYCKVLIHIANSEIALEEDQDVRNVRYR